MPDLILSIVLMTLAESVVELMAEQLNNTITASYERTY
jgi:hypothetical protein